MLRLVKKLRLRRDTIKKLTAVELGKAHAGLNIECEPYTNPRSCPGAATLPE
jgi:hypothetical protein